MVALGIEISYHFPKMGCFPCLFMNKSRFRRAGSSLPPQDRRALSGSSHAGLFGKLPYEIRYMIYVHALNGDLLHVTNAASQTKLCYHDHQGSHSSLRHYHPVEDPSPSHKIYLLKTCRQIYVEASPVLYSTNTFGIFGDHNLPVFCAFSLSIRQDYLVLIRSIRINCQADKYISGVLGRLPPRDNNFLQDWRQAWEILSTRMPGLKDLKVRLMKIYYPPLDLSLEEEWVKPMLKVRGLRRFELDLAQGIGSDQSTAEYNEKLDWFQNELQERMCSPR